MGLLSRAGSQGPGSPWVLAQRKSSSLLLVAIGLGSGLSWYRPGRSIIGADFSSPFGAVSIVHQLWSGWSQSQGMAGGSTDAVLALAFPYYVILAAMRLLSLPPGLAESLLFGVIVAGSGLGMWCLLKRWIGEGSAAFAGAFVYMMNPFVMIEWHAGHAIEQSGWALCPVVIILIDKAWHDAQIDARSIIQVLVVMLLLGSESQNAASLIGFVILPSMMYLGLCWIRSRTQVPLRLRLRRLCLLALSYVVLNTWWMVPLIYGAIREGILADYAHQTNTVSAAGLTDSPGIFNLLVGVGYWAWTQSFQGHPYFPFAHLYRNPLLRTGLLAPLVLSGEAAVLLFLDRKRITTYFAVCYVGAGYLLSAGFNGPFGLFGWAYRHVPGFIAFRSPWERFGGLAWIGFAVLIAGLLAWSPPPSVGRRWLKAACVTGMCSVGAFPMVGILFENSSVPGQPGYYSTGPPAYVGSAAAYLGHARGCMLFDPEWNYESYVAFTWAHAGFSVVESQLPCEVVTGNEAPTTKAEELADLIDGAIAKGVPTRIVVPFLSGLGFSNILVARDYQYSVYGVGPTAAQLDSYFASAGLPVHRFGEWSIYTLPAKPTGRVGLVDDVVEVRHLRTFLQSPNTDVCQFVDVMSTVRGSMYALMDGDETRSIPGQRSLPIDPPYHPESCAPSMTGSVGRTSLRPSAIRATLTQIGTNRFVLHSAGGRAVLRSIMASDPGWMLTPVGGSRGQFSVQRQTVNGFEDGWLISGRGTYVFALTYRPHVYLVLGAALTLAAIAGGLCVAAGVSRRSRRGGTKGEAQGPVP